MLAEEARNAGALRQTLAREFRPRILGFSVALLPQMRHVRETIEALAKDGAALPRALVGGPAVRMGLRPDPAFPFEIVRDLRQVAV